jgi:hypothetical protein
MNSEELLLEDLSIEPISFSEFRKMNESFHNFLPGDVDKKTSHAKEVFDMVQKSYADQGGIRGTGFGSHTDMIEHIPLWKVSKQGGKVNAVALYKDSQGRKRVATATDGTDAGKKAAGDIVGNDLKQHRAHMEISGKSLSFIKKLMPITDHLHSYDSAEKFHKSRGDTITRPLPDDKEVLRHPELKDHMYSRMIGGHAHTKVMLGSLNKTITEATMTKEEEREFGKDSTLKQGGHQYGNWSFDSGLHGPARAKERQPKWSTDDWHDLIGRGHAALTDKSKQIVKKGDKHFNLTEPCPVGIYSKSKQQMVILRVSPKNNQNSKLGGSSRIETIPPHKQSFVSPGTHRIIIEGIEILTENIIIIE